MDLEEYQRRAAYINGLYEISKVLAKNNDVLLPHEGNTSNFRIYTHDADTWKRTVEAFGLGDYPDSRVSYDNDGCIIFQPFSNFKFQIYGFHTQRQMKYSVPDVMPDTNLEPSESEMKREIVESLR